MATIEALKVFNKTLNELKECANEIREAVDKESSNAFELYCTLKDIKLVLNFSDKYLSEKEKLKQIEEIIDSVL